MTLGPMGFTSVTVMILSLRTDRSGQTEQTHIRPPSLIRVFTVCNSVDIVWTHDSTIKPHCSKFNVITAIFSGIRIFRSFTVTKGAARFLRIRNNTSLYSCNYWFAVFFAEFNTNYGTKSSLCPMMLVRCPFQHFYNTVSGIRHFLI